MKRIGIVRYVPTRNDIGKLDKTTVTILIVDEHETEATIRRRYSRFYVESVRIISIKEYEDNLRRKKSIFKL